MNRIGWILASAFVLLIVCLGTLTRALTDYWWYQQLGHGAVFTRLLGAQVVTGAAFGLGLLGFLVLNLLLARRKRPVAGVRVAKNLFEVLGSSPMVERFTARVAALAAVILSALAALEASSHGRDALLFIHGADFGKTDPLFGRDLGFYVFRLPFLEYVVGWLLFALVLGLCFSAVLYTYYRGIQLTPQKVQVAPAARLHLLTLLASFLFVYAFHFHLSTYRLLCHESTLLFGATYTDVNANLPVLRVLTVLAALAGVGVLATIFTSGWRATMVVLALLVACMVGGQTVFPTFVQRFLVAPNELEKEHPYLSNNIQYTRAAYGLDRVQQRDFAVTEQLSMQELRQNRLTIDNIRLWDRQPLLDTYRQLQQLRAYYGFFDADNDRYRINGHLMQTSLSPREMLYHMASRNWINEHLTYTHGFGVCAGPVAQIAEEGLPKFFVDNIPPRSTVPEMNVTEPRIYFGEKSDEYVFVKTASKEFDYPTMADKGEENRYTEYPGQGGVPVDSELKKFLFAVRFGEPKIQLSEDINDKSRILYYRGIRERAHRITPWVLYDEDPYMVISGGRLYWILDGYTTSDGMPYAQPVTFHGGYTINYIRNAVKTVIDAYEGTVVAYVNDETDPLVQTYQRVFPGLYHPMAEMPEDLRRHLRYPQELFAIQAEMLNTYHMEDPQVFYNKEDPWKVPAVDGHAMAPYYTVLKFPDGKDEEFILMTPFTPANRENMIAWMAARCDAPNYGQLLVYRFPKQKLVYGPSQIESRINQSPKISQQLTLWNQQGSKVLPSSLLVIPIKETLIYVKPLYLASTNASNGGQQSLPELKEVIVSYGNHVAMEETLDKALATVFSGSDSALAPQPEAPSGAAPTPPAGDAAWKRLAHEARQHMDAAEKSQREGNWAAYGEELKKLKETLSQMDASAAPTPSPTPP